MNIFLFLSIFLFFNAMAARFAIRKITWRLSEDSKNPERDKKIIRINKLILRCEISLSIVLMIYYLVTQ